MRLGAGASIASAVAGSSATASTEGEGSCASIAGVTSAAASICGGSRGVGFDMRQIELQHAFQIGLRQFVCNDQARQPVSRTARQRRRTAQTPVLRPAATTVARGPLPVVLRAMAPRRQQQAARDRFGCRCWHRLRQAVRARPAARWRQSACRGCHRENRAADSRRSQARRAPRQSPAAAPAGSRRFAAARPQAARPAGGAGRPVRKSSVARAAPLAAPNTRGADRIGPQDPRAVDRPQPCGQGDWSRAPPIADRRAPATGIPHCSSR